MNKTIQAMHFGRKSYAKPQVKAYQAKSSSIICTSPNSTSSNEEYKVESTQYWFVGN